MKSIIPKVQNDSSLVNGKSDLFFKSANTNSSPYFNPVIIQPKLKIGSPDDQYERQADRVADAVVSSPAPGIQQQSMEEEEETLQRKCSDCEKEEEIQMKSDSGQPAGTAPPGISQKIQNAAGGTQLPDSLNSEMSQKMGVDFSNVNVHTGPEASRLNQSLGARAFTHGNHIFFNSGEYNPGSREGKRLLAHELTHVVQQRHGTLVIQKFELPDWAGSLVRGGEVAIRLTLRDEGSMYAKALMRHYLLGDGQTFNPEDSAINFPTDSMWNNFMNSRPEIQRRMMEVFENEVLRIQSEESGSGTFNLNVTDIRLNELESMRLTLHGAHRVEVEGNYAITNSEPVRGTMAPSSRPTAPRVTLNNVRMVWVDVGDMHPGTETILDSGESIDDSEFTATGNSYPIRIPFEMPGNSVWEIRSGRTVKLRGWPNPSNANSSTYRE